MVHRLALLLIAVFMLTLTAQARYGQLEPGTPLQLKGSHHLFVADTSGILHWAGDLRSLEGKYVNWSRQGIVTVE